MTSLILLVLIIAAVVVVRRYLRERTERQLRDNPPQRRVIQVALPGGFATSPKEMTRFYRTVAKAATAGGPKERKTGARQLDIVYHAEPLAPGSAPLLTVRVYSDPDRMDTIKRTIKQVYGGVCEVNELKEDDLAELAELMRPKPEVEPEEMDAGPGEQEAVAA